MKVALVERKPLIAYEIIIIKHFIFTLTFIRYNSQAGVSNPVVHTYEISVVVKHLPLKH